jgi:Cu(I)/Ag(I) efflux system membrane fusion protein
MFASAVVRPRVDERGAVLNDELAGRWVGPMHPTVVKDGPGVCDICGMDLVPAESLGVVGDPSQAVEPLVVPRSAVLFTGARSVVYVEVPDSEQPTYEGREVTLGPRAGDFYIVREGLREGERVVVNGAFRIDSAMQIAAKPSMMSPAGEGGAGGHAGHGGAESARAAPEEGQAALPEAFLESLAPVYEAYLAAQESLAADDLAGFLQARDRLNAALREVREVGVLGEELAAWRRAAGRLRLDAPITTIDAARIRFERMSEGAIELAERFGPVGEPLHLAHCPMAFDDKGADWLQRGEQINNPYFGAMMLMCGEIRRSFPAGGAASETSPGQPDSGDADEHEGHDHG